MTRHRRISVTIDEKTYEQIEKMSRIIKNRSAIINKMLRDALGEDE